MCLYLHLRCPTSLISNYSQDPLKPNKEEDASQNEEQGSRYAFVPLLFQPSLNSLIQSGTLNDGPSGQSWNRGSNGEV